MEVLLFKKLDVPTWENECMVMVVAKKTRERELVNMDNGQENVWWLLI